MHIESVSRMVVGHIGKQVLFVIALSSVIAIGVSEISCAQKVKSITGVGSTFAGPLYQNWAEGAEKEIGVQVNYQPLGSGAGRNQIISKTVSFGALDVPTSVEKLTKNNLVQFPTAIGGIAVVVNIPNIKHHMLRLTGPIIADIYSGKIKKWNDPKITEINKDVVLEDLDIAPIYRADGSGTTQVFTSYLVKESHNWAETYGSNTSIAWPLGIGGRGNGSVASMVKNIKGSIGYVEFAYALQNHLCMVQLKDSAGEYITLTEDSLRAAAKTADWVHSKNFNVDLINIVGENAWPIVSTTYVLVPAYNQNSKGVVKFFRWAFDKGDGIAYTLHYVPLPIFVKEKIEKTWEYAGITPNNS
ncbi:Phosphate-binding protein PstS [Commensalibacter sp. Nvir]|nr:Phosphate-binding protein PstS [Commensalibacter sp. Nvir]